MRKVAVIGLFCIGKEVADGQSIKTRIVAQEIERKLGEGEVTRIDTYGWKRNPFKLFFRSMLAVWSCDNVIFMTDEGGIKFFPWLLLLFNIFRTTSLHYVVVGGWLIHFVKKNAFIRACLKRFKGIYAETTVMKNAMENVGFRNIVLMPNFKRLEIVETAELRKQYEVPLRFCTFSRVMCEKGIDDAAEAVREVNKAYGKLVCTLDIYGQVDPEQTEWFEKLKASFPPEVCYCGVIDYHKSTEVLKEYFALLFPTEFYTEGIPGTIIDAYATGVPVISSRWESFADVVDDGLTGIGYPFGKQEKLREILSFIVESPEIICNMKENCLEKVQKYLPDEVMNILFSRLS